MGEARFTLTANQFAQLRALWDAGATTHVTARPWSQVRDLDRDLMPLLERMGYVATYNGNRTGRGDRYFLTPAGVAEARKPSQARRG